MLVLSRKHQQQIKIGNDITVTILRIQGNTIRVGIEAPKDVHIVRGELAPQMEFTLTDAESDEADEEEVRPSRASLAEIYAAQSC